MRNTTILYILSLLVVGCGTDDKERVFTETRGEEVVITEPKDTVIEGSTEVVTEPELQLASFVITSPTTGSSYSTEEAILTIQWSSSSLEALSLTENTISYDLKVGSSSDCSNPSHHKHPLSMQAVT